MPKRITEASTLTVTESPTPGRVRLQLIDAGWGSSGYYSPTVLENAATEQVFGKGTHVFFDHPSESERHDRPERSVRDLAMVLDEDATYDQASSALVAEAKVIGPYRDLVTDDVFMEAVGMSIRASADTTIGEADGRKGTIVTQLIEGVSVDLVTRAGRGGRILAAVESARRDMSEATANDTREALTAALRDAYGDEHTWVWVRDFDENLVWFEVEDADSYTTFQHGYALDDAGAANLADGDPTPVRARTEYVPVDADTGAPTDVPAPAGQSEATTHSQEENMATTQIEESQLAALRQDAERVPTLESERDTATARADALEARLAERDRRDQIAAVIESVEGHEALTVLERRGLAADAHTSDDGSLDDAALRTAVETAVAERAAQNGAGSITGFGATETNDQVVESADDAVAAAFGRTIKEA